MLSLVCSILLGCDTSCSPNWPTPPILLFQCPPSKDRSILQLNCADPQRSTWRNPLQWMREHWKELGLKRFLRQQPLVLLWFGCLKLKDMYLQTWTASRAWAVGTLVPSSKAPGGDIIWQFYYSATDLLPRSMMPQLVHTLMLNPRVPLKQCFDILNTLKCSSICQPKKTPCAKFCSTPHGHTL